MSYGLKSDRSKATQPSFELLPNGKYEVFISGTQAGKSTQKGTDYVELVFTVRDDVEQVGKGRKIWHTLWFTEKTEGMINGFYEAVGVPDGMEFESYEEVAAFLKGKPLKVNVSSESYPKNDGTTGMKNVVKSWTPSLIGGEFDPGEAFEGGQVPTVSDEDLPF